MRTVVVGATGALGFGICQRLRARGHAVLGIHRKPSPALAGRLEDAGCELQRVDIRKHDALADWIAPGTALVLTPILSTSGPALRALPPQQVARAVVFSSNNVHLDTGCTKYQAIRAEEDALASAGIPHTLIRPTMIYGHARDGNLSRVMAMAKRYPLLPVPAYGQVRCQPIHVDDLADLAAEAVTSDAIGGQVLAAGPTPLTMADLMGRIRRAAGFAQAVVPVPVWMLKLAARVMPLPLDAAQLSRAKQHRVPSTVPDVAGWKPRISIDEGLARLARALDEDRSTPHMEWTDRPASGGFHVGHTGHPVRHRRGGLVQ